MSFPNRGQHTSYFLGFGGLPVKSGVEVVHRLLRASFEFVNEVVHNLPYTSMFQRLEVPPQDIDEDSNSVGSLQIGGRDQLELLKSVPLQTAQQLDRSPTRICLRVGFPNLDLSQVGQERDRGAIPRGRLVVAIAAHVTIGPATPIVSSVPPSTT
jgi:hypothetical protein